ncbi:MAG TPA: hypothetical protein PKO06_06785 [Candidatus Ozemobacteraceae bacterium]|nr:hypothetical protein [Candidatus Ozemobacteraceae bacterium]
MNLFESLRISNRLLVYAMMSTLVVAFGCLGTLIIGYFEPNLAILGLLLGSVFGVFIALHESSVVGSLIGMLAGMILGCFVYLLIDFETAYLTVFVLSLFGAFMGEPFAYFWREANRIGEDLGPTTVSRRAT